MKKDIFEIIEAYDKVTFETLVQEKLDDGWRIINCDVTSTQADDGDFAIIVYTAFMLT
jgi:hypothetical protein